MSKANLESMNSSTLLQFLEQSAGEKALLTFSDAPAEELRNAQASIDKVTAELMRRLSW